MEEMEKPLAQDRKEELQLLKEMADRMGIKYSGNIGVDTLRAKVNERLEAGAIKTQNLTDMAKLREKIRKEELKLIRIKLVCLNPMKKAWRGEIFTVANSFLGTVKKFVPYDARFYVNGYHVPYCIYKMLKRKKFLDIKTIERNGKITVTTQHVPEFGIEVLPQLTKEELQELARAQQAGNRID